MAQPKEGRKKGQISREIAKRLRRDGMAFGPADSIGELITSVERAAILKEATDAMAAVLDALVINREDPHTRGTAERVARLYVNEVFAGRYEPRPPITDFPNGKKLDELYTLGPIDVRSACAHHFCPVIGQLWVGVIPSERVIGISKFSRLSRWILARPQIQEDAIMQLADELERTIKPRGLGIVIRASHSCMTWRGVRESGTVMQTNVMRGIIKESPSARAEFMQSIQARGFTCL